MAADDGTGNTTTRDEVAFFKRGRHFGFELIRRVAIAVGNDDLIASKQARHPAPWQLDPLVLLDLDDPRQHEIAGLRGRIQNQALHPGLAGSPRGIRGFRRLDAFR